MKDFHGSFNIKPVEINKSNSLVFIEGALNLTKCYSLSLLKVFLISQRGVSRLGGEDQPNN